MSERGQIIDALNTITLPAIVNGKHVSSVDIINALHAAGYQITPQAGEAEPVICRHMQVRVLPRTPFTDPPRAAMEDE